MDMDVDSICKTIFFFRFEIGNGHFLYFYLGNRMEEHRNTQKERLLLKRKEENT